MTGERRWHPDFLRRFVATPYVFQDDEGEIQSNDLGIVLEVRRWRRGFPASKWKRLQWRLLRDVMACEDGGPMCVVSEGSLRVLFRGQSTVLAYDAERCEVLGFLPEDAQADVLVTELLPMLFCGMSPFDEDSTLLQTSDKHNIAR